MSILVLVRHGKTEWSSQNRFAGWADAPLSDTGRQEAQGAGRVLTTAGYRFDHAYTSYLSRAIETLDIILDELGNPRLPVERCWRLNERHYGALQGLNKKETAEQYGDDQVFAWRRGYDTPPPSLEEHDERHAKHDPRYRKLPPDLLPPTECLKDVVERMLPYWYDAIVPDILAGELVIVAAHGNSLRALVKHLDGISDDDIPELNIPTGIPLIYELDDDMKRISSRYLGDQEAAEAAANAVARQAG